VPWPSAAAADAITLKPGRTEGYTQALFVSPEDPPVVPALSKQTRFS
jgi:hypothetical protein